MASSWLNLTCFPNPFNQFTTIAYRSEEPGNVTLKIVDLLGKEVAVIIENEMQAIGDHQIQFSKNNLKAVIYTCVLQTGSQIVTKSIVIKE